MILQKSKINFLTIIKIHDNSEVIERILRKKIEGERIVSVLSYIEDIMVVLVTQFVNLSGHISVYFIPNNES